jgi:hypothetical protein
MKLYLHGSLIGLILVNAGAARAQTNQQQVFHFEHTPDVKSAQELATSIRTVLEIPQVKVSDDNPPSTLTVGGTEDQLKAAGWLFTELDQATQVANMREYQLSGTGENVVRIYYVTQAQTIQQFQEIATAIRTVAEIRRVFTYNAPKAIIARGTPGQMAFFEWLLPLMDRPLNAKPQHSVSGEYTFPDQRDEGTTHVFYAGYAANVKDFQSLATALRTIAQIRRVFTYNDAQAIALRGTPAQLTMAQWLFDQLDQPANGLVSGSSFSAAGPDDVVQVFDLAQAKVSQDLPNVVAQIRTSTKTQYAFSYGSRSLMVLRGTAAQIAAAQNLVEQLNRP